MSVDRRQILTGVGLAAALSAAGSVSACSPPPILDWGHQNFFSLISARKFEDASALLAKDVRLMLITFERQEMFEGAKHVIGRLSNLMLSDGLQMIGDSNEFSAGGYWGSFGGWETSDLMKGSVIEMTLGCGDEGELSTSVLNVFLRKNESNDNVGIEQIVLMESRNLNFGRGFDAGATAAAEFGQK